MKLKLDENLGRRGADMLRDARHDVRTVAEEGLLSTPDREILDYCRLEGRALVTLDKGFADPMVHNPADYAGIIVLRLPRKPKRVHLNKAIRVLIAGLERHRLALAGSLWLVRLTAIRMLKQRTSDD